MNNQITEYDKIMIDTINSYVTALSDDTTKEELTRDIVRILIFIKGWLTHEAGGELDEQENTSL